MKIDRTLSHQPVHRQRRYRHAVPVNLCCDLYEDYWTPIYYLKWIWYRSRNIMGPSSRPVSRSIRGSFVRRALYMFSFFLIMDRLSVLYLTCRWDVEVVFFESLLYIYFLLQLFILDPMRFHISIALSASFVTALFTEWPQENLFDDPTPLEEYPSSYNTDDFLWDPFSTTVAVDPPLDDVSFNMECASSGPDDFMDNARIRREEGICPSPVSLDTDEFNRQRFVRSRIQLIQDKAQQEGRMLPFCPPPTLPLCCVGTLEYLGLSVNDCEPCIPTNTLSNLFSPLCSTIIWLTFLCCGTTIDNPLITACLDLVNIFCCTSYGVSFSLLLPAVSPTWTRKKPRFPRPKTRLKQLIIRVIFLPQTYTTSVVDISTGIQSQAEVGYGSICVRVFGLPIVFPFQW